MGACACTSTPKTLAQETQSWNDRRRRLGSVQLGPASPRPQASGPINPLWAWLASLASKKGVRPFGRCSRIKGDHRRERKLPPIAFKKDVVWTRSHLQRDSLIQRPGILEPRAEKSAARKEPGAALVLGQATTS